MPHTTASPELEGSPADPLKNPEFAPEDGALDVEVLIVGAGVSGIGVGIELRRRGRHSFVLLEAGERLGGTWRDNTYPGVAVDIPSISYCYSYDTDYPWSRAFAPGREILDYVQGCAERHGVAPHIRYDSRVQACRFDGGEKLWRVALTDGTEIRARFVVSATGILATPKYPDIEGLSSFAGKAMHTARWDHAHDLTGRRVAVIGTGASAVQVVPAIADPVEHLTVFQRTPIWVAPRPDRRLSHGALAPRRFGAFRFLLRLYSELNLEIGTFAITNYRRLPFLVGIGERFLRGVMRRWVSDPALREKLTPKYGLGCKRPAISNRYIQSFLRDDVALVTESIARIVPEGVVTTDGALHPVDTLVLATGFLTTERGNSPSFEVFGDDGAELGQLWEDERMQAYVGMTMPGFPNFFLTSGPYAGGLNWFTMLETHVRHILQCMETAWRRGARRVEVDREAHERYMAYMWKRSDGAVFKDARCVAANSYYIDRHGDAALPLPQTPWWRAMHLRLRGVRDYRFS